MGAVNTKGMSPFPIQVSGRKLESLGWFWSHAQTKTLNNKIQKLILIHSFLKPKLDKGITSPTWFPVFQNLADFFFCPHVFTTLLIFSSFEERSIFLNCCHSTVFLLPCPSKKEIPTVLLMTILTSFPKGRLGQRYQ